MEYPVELMMERYCFYRQKYVMSKDDFTKAIPSKYWSRQVWEHLNGSLALCVFAGPSKTKFLTLDIDMRDAEVVQHVISVMEELGIPRDLIYVSDSGNKGYHVDIFFSNSIYNWKAKELYDLIIYFGELNPRKIEYRPTANQAIKLPLGIHQKTGRRCWFLNRDTLEPIESFDYIEATSTIDVAEIDRIIEEGNRRRFDKMLSEMPAEERRVPVHNGTEAPIMIEESGTRQKKMVEQALRLYREGGTQDSIEDGLESWLQLQNPAFYKDSYEECRRNIVNIAKWVMRKGVRGAAAEKRVVSPQNRIHIYQSDAERILAMPTKTARMMAFLITAYCDKYGVCSLGQDKMCEILSIKSRRIIVQAAKEMKCFDSVKGGLKNVKNELKKVTTKYTFPEYYERSGEVVSITAPITADSIYEIYLGTIGDLCNGEDLKKRLKKPEYEDMLRYAHKYD